MRRLHHGIYEHLRGSLCGDPLFKQYLTKNPLHEAYEVNSFTGNTYDFSDFLGPAVDFSGDDFVLAPKWQGQFQGKNPDIAAVPTNLKEAAGPKGSRVWNLGYPQVHRRRSADYAIIYAIYEKVACDLGSPITPKELAGMAKRSVRWMVAHPNMLGTPARDLRDIDHGVMRREAEQRGQAGEWRELDIRSKRTLAAERTNSIRKASTEQRITQAVVSMLDRHLPITQKTLQKESSVCLRTIKQLWNKVLESATIGASRSNPFSPEGVTDHDDRPLRTLEEIPVLGSATIAASRSNPFSPEGIKDHDERPLRTLEEISVLGSAIIGALRSNPFSPEGVTDHDDRPLRTLKEISVLGSAIIGASRSNPFSPEGVTDHDERP